MQGTRFVDPAAELESVHAYAAEFGCVLEWCAFVTDGLFNGSSLSAEYRRARVAAEEAWGSWDARRVERSMSREVG